MVGAAVGLGARTATTPTTKLPPTTLQAIQLEAHMDVHPTPGEDGYLHYEGGQQWATWTVELGPKSPWVPRLAEALQNGDLVEIEMPVRDGRFIGGGRYHGTALVTDFMQRHDGKSAVIVNLTSYGPIMRTFG
jgi:hypothetical protein